MKTVSTQAQTYVLRLVKVEDRTYPGGKHPIPIDGCFTEIDNGRPVWKCRDYHEDVYVKDNHLIISKHYRNCVQANVIDEEENPQFVLCASGVLEYVYKLVPILREDLIAKMHKIAEEARRFRTILVGSILYAVKHHDKLYVLDFFYDPIMHAVRAIIKYIIPI